MIERMTAYQRTTGLKPVGIHRPAAEKLLKGVSHRCVQCDAQGYFKFHSAWLWCEVCGGLGRVMTPRAQLLLRGRVAERFPGLEELETQSEAAHAISAVPERSLAGDLEADWSKQRDSNRERSLGREGFA